MESFSEVRLVRHDDRRVVGETKFGGEPMFFCGEIVEECCGQRMSLLGQFDELDFPEAGLPGRMIAYIFICRQCYAVTCAASAPG